MPDKPGGSVQRRDSTILREFKKNTGNTFLEYLHKRRIEAAKTLIRTTPISLTEIAVQVGYDNALTMRAFKKYEGVTPRHIPGNLILVAMGAPLQRLAQPFRMSSESKKAGVASRWDESIKRATPAPKPSVSQ